MPISHEIGGGRILATNIFTDPQATSSFFVILGSIKGGSSDGKFAAIYLDFSSVWSRQCTFRPDVALSDYESWDYLNGTCNLGGKVILTIE